MNVKDRVRYDMFIRADEFGKTNVSDFPAKSIGGKQFAEVAAVISLIRRLITDQTTGRDDARFSFNSKASAREDLRDEMSVINRTARAMSYENPGIDLKFRMPANSSDANLLAAARAFYASSEEYADAMVEYGLDADFRAELNDAIREFEESLNAPGAAIDTHVEATADIGEAIRRGMTSVKILDGIVRNRYRNDAGKLAAWTSASHIERIPKKQQPPPVTK